MTMFSPWQWFCSTRTFSNSLEVTLTIMALYYWPWKITSETILGPGSDSSLRDREGRPLLAKPTESGVFATPASIRRYCFLHHRTSSSTNHLQSSHLTRACWYSMYPSSDKRTYLVLNYYANSDSLLFSRWRICFRLYHSI